MPSPHRVDAINLLTSLYSIRRRETAPTVSSQHPFASTQRNVQSRNSVVGSANPETVGYSKSDTPMPSMLEEHSSIATTTDTTPTPESLSELEMPSFNSVSIVQGKGVRFQSQALSSRSTDNAGESDYIDSHANADSLVMSSDLGEGLDAVVLERGGRLERVVMNLRKGTPTVAALQRLSRELWQVADALQAAAAGSQVASDAAELQNDHAQDVADLLHHIHEAAGPELGFAQETETSSTYGSADHVPAVRRDFATQQNVPTLDFIPSPATRMAHRQSINADFAALRRHFGHDSSDHAERQADEPDVGVASSLAEHDDRTSHDAPADLATSGLMTSRRSSTPNIPDITITDDSHEHNPTLPSHILKAQDMVTSTRAYDGNKSMGNKSPLIFSSSTAPSLDTDSALPSPSQATVSPLTAPSRIQTWQDLTEATAPSASSIPAEVVPLNPDRAVIRKAMGMNKNKAVQEAAAQERQARRQRQIDARNKAFGIISGT